MHATLKVVSGSDAGKQITLEPGTVLRVGRSDKTDFAFSNDDRMSRIHFAIRFNDDGTCEVRDLNSRSGLFKNKDPVKEAAIGATDQITAGRTVFAVEFVDVPSDSEQSSSKSWFPEPITAATGKFQYVRKDYSTGLAAFIGQSENPSPLELAKILAAKQPLYVIADLVKFGAKLPAGYSPDILFDWLPREWIVEFSPILVAPGDSLDRFDLIERGWGADGLVCVFTSLDKRSLLASLRAAARGPTSPEDPPAASDLVGCCWPASLAAILAHGRSESVRAFASPVDAFLVEAKSPAGWQIFAQPAFQQSLDLVGSDNVASL